jgi:hypothetical protein
LLRDRAGRQEADRFRGCSHLAPSHRLARGHRQRSSNRNAKALKAHTK